MNWSFLRNFTESANIKKANDFFAAAGKKIAALISDVSNAKASIDNINTGWKALAGTCTFASVDDPTGVINVPSGHGIEAGYFLKLVNNNNTIYGIVQVATVTQITFTHEINPSNSLALHLMISAPISDVYYSPSKFPPGFPREERKWTRKLRYTTTTTIATPVNGTWYNPDGKYLDIPIGEWKTKLRMCVDAVRTSGNEVTVYASFSTSSNAETDIDFTTFGVFGATGATAIRTCLNAVTEEKNLTLTSKTRYYPIAKVGRDGVANMYIQNVISPMVISAVCAYLKD